MDSSRKLRQVVEVWRDISERRAAEAHMAESHRLASLGLLASGFSHELNTPLATVLTCLESIQRETAEANGGGPDLARLRESASIGREQILRCRGITQHFLRLSRGQRSPGDVVEIGAAVEMVRRPIEPAARGHSVSVEVTGMNAEVLARADEADLQHALVNLILNAVQACRRTLTKEGVKRALAEDESWLKRSPADAEAKSSVAMDHAYLASLAATAGRYEDALSQDSQALAMLREIHGADPRDVRTRESLLHNLRMSAKWEKAAGRPERSAAFLKEAGEVEKGQ